MRTPNMGKIVGIVITLIIIGVLLPIGLGYVSSMGDVSVTVNNTTSALSSLVDPTVLTLMTVMIPIGVAISLLLYFIPRD
jgi:hypothetical protein